MAGQEIRVRRVYDEPAPDDGVRVLVDRIWPRGMRTDEAHLDEWVKDVAPSTTLRRWFGHDPDKFAEFESRYRRELDEPARRVALENLRDLLDRGPVTLLTSTRDVSHSHVAVLAKLLRH